MSLTADSMTPADIRACTCGNDSNGGGWGFGGDGLIALIVLFLFGSMFGWGGMGMGGFGGFGGFGGGNILPWLLYGNGGFGGRCGEPCATQSDVRAAVDQQTLISKLDQQTYGLADSTYALNNAITGGFSQAELSRCNQQAALMAQLSAMQADAAKCCCDIRAEIQENTTQGVMNTNSLSRQLSDCCCDLEKMNMQNRFDAQAYNCNTLQAIDKLGDRIIDYINTEKTQALRDENQALRLRASRADQNNVLRAAIDASTAEIIRRTGNDCPVPAYVVPNPNCCYGNPLGVGYNSYGFANVQNFGNHGGCCNSGNF